MFQERHQEGHQYVSTVLHQVCILQLSQDFSVVVPVPSHAVWDQFEAFQDAHAFICHLASLLFSEQFQRSERDRHDVQSFVPIRNSDRAAIHSSSRFPPILLLLLVMILNLFSKEAKAISEIRKERLSRIALGSDAKHSSLLLSNVQPWAMLFFYSL